MLFSRTKDLSVFKSYQMLTHCDRECRDKIYTSYTWLEVSEGFGLL
jgi:hypothetical protein